MASLVVLKEVFKNPNELSKDKRRKQHETSETSREALEKLTDVTKKSRKYTSQCERSKERSGNTYSSRHS